MSLKINGGLYKGLPLDSPSGNKTRPTSSMLREAVFNICQHKISDAHFLDLYAGTGAMGIEALSRGASFSVFIEKDRNALICIKKNLEKISAKEKSLIIASDLLTGLKKINDFSFDIIYIDPPYGEKKEELAAEKALDSVLAFLDQSTLLKEESWVFVEFSSYSKKDFSSLTLNNLHWDHKRTFARSDLHLFKVLKKA